MEYEYDVLIVNLGWTSPIMPWPLTVLGTHLVNRGKKVRLIDGHYVSDISKEISNARLIGFSVMTAQIAPSLRISREIKRIYPDKFIVWGGVHPTLCPEQCLQEDSIDFIIAGDGEEALTSLTTCLENKDYNFKDIPGLGFKNNGDVIVNPMGKPVKFEEAAPWKYELLDMRNYMDWQLMLDAPFKRPSISYLATRGCPKGCTFCINSVVKHTRKYRAKPVECVLDEIEQLIHKYNVCTINFPDEAFFLNTNYFASFVTGILNRNLRFQWGGGGHISDILRHKDLILDAKKAGLIWIGGSGESGSNRLLRLLKKNITVEDTIECMHFLADNDLLTASCFMTLLPTETNEETKATLDLLDYLRKIFSKKNNPSYIMGPSVFRPYPGSELYNMCVESGFKEPETLEDWTRMVLPDGNFKIDNISWLGESTCYTFNDMEESKNRVNTIWQMRGTLSAENNRKQPGNSEDWMISSEGIFKLIDTNRLGDMKQNDVLYAFYDLEVAPATFDIATFLIIAEIERKNTGCNHLQVIIVPGPDDGFRSNQLNLYRQLGATDYQLDVMRWRLRNILVPCCWMLPSCQKVTICTSREEAEAIEFSLAEHVFPKAYKVNSPVSCHENYNIINAASKEFVLPSFKATPQALIFVEDWIKNNVGEKKLITITLRECAYEHARNSNIKEWGSFARSLDPKIYCPVVLRDADTAFSPLPPELEGLTVFRDAVWNLELRAALNELSYLNMYVANGPSVFCLFNRKTRFIMFYKKNTCGAATYGYLRSQGLEPGSQYKWMTSFQQIVWEDDRVDVIQKTFKEMCDRIENFSFATLPDLINFFNEMLNKNDLNNAEWASSLLTDRFADHHVAWHVRAIALRLTNQPKEALSAIERSIRLNATPDSLSELIRIYQALGLHDKASQLSADMAKAQELKQPLTLQF